MLILKRFLAFIIDLFFFYSIGISTDWVFDRLGFDLNWFDKITITFICSTVIPILLFNNSFGGWILRVTLSFKNKILIKLLLLGKYGFYFLIYTGIYFRYFQFAHELLFNYTYLDFPISISVRILIIFCILNILTFLFSGGRINFIDRLFGLDYATEINGAKLNFLISAYILSISLLVSSIVEFNTGFKYEFDKQLDLLTKTETHDYFPKEEFSSFIKEGFAFSEIERTNRIITLSNVESFTYNRYLLQRKFIVFVNDNLLQDKFQRFKFCARIIKYMEYNLKAATVKNEIDQTKIILINFKMLNPFVSKYSAFTYYYDNKTPVFGIYGGFNPDSLIQYYLDVDKKYRENYLNELSKRLNISVDTIEKYFLSENEASSNDIANRIADSALSMRMTFSYNIKKGALTRLLFDDVKPKETVYLNFFGNPLLINPGNFDVLLNDEKIDSMYDIKESYIFSR